MPEPETTDAPESAADEPEPNGDPEGSEEVEASEDAEEEATEELSPFLQAIKAPISDDQPAGDSVTYDDDFQQLKTQINEIGSASGEADYETIAKLARRILTEKSKDLRAAGYLVIGEARLNGPAGMAEATTAVRLLIDEYWEELYPAKRRMQGRGSALQFISDRLGDWFETTSFDPPDREPLVAARDDLKAIQDFGLQEMGEYGPSFSGLMKRMNKAIDKLPKPEPEPEPEPEPSADESEEETSESTADASAPQAGAPTEIGSESDATKVVRMAAEHFREENLTDPLAYRLMRTIRWGVLRTEPPSEGGTTRIEAPREQRRNYLSGLLEEGDYETLVREGESSFQWETFHFWLDLQRLIASALDALGKPYQAARDAVMIDVALLVDRLPGLLTLTYSDGTPFASPLTQDWIETQVQPKLAGDGTSGGGAVGGDGQMPAAEQYDEARQRLSSGDLGEALAIMKEGAAQDTSDKETFYRRLYIATLCMKGSQPAVARPLLDELDAAIERHAIDAWDPSLALEVWTNRCQCYDLLAQQAPPENKEALFAEADASFEKICRVDAAEAVSVASRRPR